MTHRALVHIVCHAAVQGTLQLFVTTVRDKVAVRKMGCGTVAVESAEGLVGYAVAVDF